MDEEFKVRFVVDMGDTEKRVKRLKDDFVSLENNEVHFKTNIGDINKNANSVFQNIRHLMENVEKNPIWSNAKKQEYLKFFKGMEATANKAFHTMESRYSKLAQDLSSWDSQKNALQVELDLKDGQAEKIRHEIDEEMSKKGNTGTYADLVKMQNEYNKLTSLKFQAKKNAEDAVARRDRPEYDAWMSDLEKIDAYQKKIMADMQNFKIGESTGGPDYDKVAKLREKYDEIQKETVELDKELSKMGNNPAMEKKRQELEAIRIEYGKLMADMQSNPLDDQFKSQTLQTLEPQVENLNDGLSLTGSKIKWNTKLTESWGRVMSRLKSRVMFSIVSMLNPIRIIRQAWSGFLDQNVKTKNTLKMIGLNLQKVIAPLLQKIAELILKIAQYANVLTKSWFNVDLFDKSVLSAQKTEDEIKKINKLTAGFDELNVFSEETEEANADKNSIWESWELPQVDTAGLEKWANEGFGKNIGDALNWALEHPLESAGIMLGGKLIGGLVGDGAKSLLKKGITKLFGGGEAAEGAATGGGLLAKIFGKELYTGMAGQSVTLGKALGGIGLGVGGTALAIGQGIDAGKNWQDLTDGAKAGKVALVGLGSAAAGLGAVMLGASGPVGWAVAGVVALGAFAIGMAQVQDGIGSVKDETEKLSVAQNNAVSANSNYLNAAQNLASTMANLEYLENQTGISGAQLAAQVDSGAISVENMSSAQMAVYSAYLKNKDAIRQLQEAEKAKLEADRQLEIQSAKTQIALAKESGDYQQVKQSIMDAWQQGKISTEDARDLIERAMGSMSKEARQTWMEEIPEAIKDGLDTTHYASGWEKFGDGIAHFFDNAKQMAKDAWEGIKGAFSQVGEWFHNIFKNAWERVLAVFSAGGKIFQGIKEGIQRTFSRVVNGIITGINKVIAIPFNAINGALNKLRGVKIFELQPFSWLPTINVPQIPKLPEYDVGTNYVPNDQLAIVHKGEAIVPAKYNNEKAFGNHDAYLRNTLDAMNSEIASLRNLINQGIPVTGEFVQRGSDLYATVEKAKGKRGNQPLSNPSYAR